MPLLTQHDLPFEMVPLEARLLFETTSAAFPSPARDDGRAYRPSFVAERSGCHQECGKQGDGYATDGEWRAVTPGIPVPVTDR